MKHSFMPFTNKQQELYEKVMERYNRNKNE